MKSGKGMMQKKLSIEELKKWVKENSENGKRADAIRELIAIRELKGEQVPVAYVCTSFLDAKEDFTISKRLPVGTPLYDRPQKPVVLPQRYSSASIAGQAITVKDTSGDLLDRLQVIAAIEAAGGIVKESE